MIETSPGARVEKVDDGRLVDRRGMLTAVAATTAGVIGALAVPGIAAANIGDAVLVGASADATGTSTALWGRNLAGTGVGIVGESANNDGIRGFSSATGMSGIWGKSYASGGAGLTGDGLWAGVYGRTLTGDGVRGTTAAAGKSGAYGMNTNAGGYGVFGEAASGVGVLAKSTAGTALKVDGKAALTRSGITSISKNKKTVTIAVPGGVTTTSKFFVSMRNSLGSGVNIAYTKSSGSTGFKVYLNKKATKKASVSWMVLD